MVCCVTMRVAHDTQRAELCETKTLPKTWRTSYSALQSAEGRLAPQPVHHLVAIDDTY